MPEPKPVSRDFGALLPGIGVFGGVRRFLEIGNELVRRGHRYVLYHPDGTSPDWLSFAGEVRPLAALGASSHQILLCGDPGLVSEFENARARLKLFYCVHKNLPDRRITRHPDWVVLANSTEIQNRLWRRHRVRAENAIGGIDLEVFHRPKRGPTPTGDPFRVLVYGRLSRSGKGTQLAVRAAEKVSHKLGQRFPAWAGTSAHPVQLVLFDHLGPGNERDPRPAFQSRIPHEFHLDRSQEHLASLYASCHVFVAAEHRAGWSNTVAEAMACGVPVVCTGAGTGDLARHLETAWVVRWRHPHFLATGLHAVLTKPALGDRLRRNASRQILQFSWARVVDRIEDIVERHGLEEPDAPSP